MNRQKVKKYTPDFKKLSKQIKKENKHSKCWKCEHFNGFWYDGVTYDCLIDGTLMWGDEVYCNLRSQDAKEEA